MKRAKGLRLLLGIGFTFMSQGCSQPVPQSVTADFDLSGRAAVVGSVLDSSGVPVDSFQVTVSVPDGSALYQTQQFLTTSNGQFAITIERRGATTTIDSVLGSVNATSLRGRERNADGSAIVVSVPVWLRFFTPPAIAVSRTVTVRAPVAK